jgi:hypothetical protein
MTVYSISLVLILSVSIHGAFDCPRMNKCVLQVHAWSMQGHFSGPVKSLGATIRHQQQVWYEPAEASDAEDAPRRCTRSARR